MVAETEDYLGAQLSKMEANDGTGRQFWSISLEKYCQAAIPNVEEQLDLEGKRFLSKYCTPLKSLYDPEMDVTPEFKAAGVQYYQKLIGVLYWVCEIGLVNIWLEM